MSKAAGSKRLERLVAVIGPRYKPSKHAKTFKGTLPMAIERTLSIIKPDVTERNLTGQIKARLEGAASG